MKKSKINFTVDLDANNIPDKIHWDATDNPNEGINDTKAISLAVWDHYQKGTLKIDLWTKDMEVFEMKRFYIEVMSGIADSLTNATNDTQAGAMIEELCQKLSKRLDDEINETLKRQQQGNA